MYNAGAKFEEHSFDISRVILNWVLCCVSGATYDVIAFLFCLTQKRKTPFFFTIFSKAFQILKILKIFEQLNKIFEQLFQILATFEQLFGIFLSNFLPFSEQNLDAPTPRANL